MPIDPDEWETIVSEKTAWILTFVFGGTAVVATIVYMIMLATFGVFNLQLTGGMIALFIVTGIFFRKASHMRTQRVVSKRADDFESPDDEMVRQFYGE